jgi:hypothetical protein
LKHWYGVLLAFWLTVMLPGSCILVQAANASGRRSWPDMYFSLVVGTLDLLRELPLGPLVFALVWSPLLAAPFGLFERIYEE